MESWVSFTQNIHGCRWLADDFDHRVSKSLKLFYSSTVNMDTKVSECWSGKNIFTNNLRYLNDLRCRYNSYQTPKPLKWTHLSKKISAKLPSYVCYSQKVLKLLFCPDLLKVTSNVDGATDDISSVFYGWNVWSQWVLPRQSTKKTLKLHQAIVEH